MHALRKIYYALLLARKGGSGILLRQFGSRLYSKTSYMWLTMDLNALGSRSSSAIQYTIQPATPETFEKLRKNLNGEKSSQDIFEIIKRISFYDRGFDACYVALTDSGELCHLHWLLSPRYNDLIQANYPSGMRELREGEAMLENGFTFPRYRGKGIMTSAMLDLAAMARSRGFSRLVAQVDKKNKASLKACYRAGFRDFAEQPEIRLLFSIHRRQETSREDRQNNNMVVAANTASRPGVLVILGSFQSLGILRSLANHRVPTYLIDWDFCVGRFSRCTNRFATCPSVGNENEFLEFLKNLAVKENLKGWLIYPNDDRTVGFLARYKKELEEFYRVPVPAWDIVKFAYDKRLTYELAERAGIPIPRTLCPRSIDELEHMDIGFPAVIKPSIRDNFYDKAKKKAVRADNMAQLVQEYLKAATIIDRSEIMVQELIPGGADNLYSFGSLYRDGKVLGKLVAHRARQHPAEFGRVTTHAETVDIAELEDMATHFLEVMRYQGVSEIEFMRDPRDGKYKLIEMNARFWAWHSLAIAAGVDLPYLLYLDVLGDSVQVSDFEKGVKWFRLLADIPTSTAQVARGKMSIGNYSRSWRGKKTFSVLSLKDPLPFLAEIFMLPYIWKKRGL